MTRCIRNGLAAFAALGLPLLPSVTAAEIPSALEPRGQVPDKAEAAAILGRAGLPAGDAAAKADSLDRVELTELAQSDLSQKGGGPIGTIVLVAAIAVLLIILL